MSQLTFSFYQPVRLTKAQKYLLGLISILDKGDGAWPSNSYLQQKTGKCRRTVQNWLDILHGGGLIRVQIQKGRIQRRLFITEAGTALLKQKNCTPAAPRFAPQIAPPGPTPCTQREVKEQAKVKEVRTKPVVQIPKGFGHRIERSPGQGFGHKTPCQLRQEARKRMEAAS